MSSLASCIVVCGLSFVIWFSYQSVPNIGETVTLKLNETFLGGTVKFLGITSYDTVAPNTVAVFGISAAGVPGSELKVRIGSTFSIGGMTFKVISLNPTDVTVTIERIA